MIEDSQKEGESRSFFSFISHDFYFIGLFILIILLSAAFIFTSSSNNKSDTICGDGTPYSNCSLTKPYYCSNGDLIEKSSLCKCPEGFSGSNGACNSNLTQGKKTVLLSYVLDGEKKNLSFDVYQDAEAYFTGISRSVYYGVNETPSRTDFKLRIINEAKQKDLLMPLVVKIQNITSDKEDQLRIATSIVQNIEWGESNKTRSFGGNKIQYSRYPYEVLYENKGVCGEKSELLVFLLKNLGFQTAIFYNLAENHESVGVKCSSHDWKGTGYCFIETSGPAIISDNSLIYSGGATLMSMPEVLKISNGTTLSRSLNEYGDAKEMMKIRNKIQSSGVLNFYYEWRYNKLKEKYGLDGEYKIG